MNIITTFPYLMIFGQDMVYWTGILSGIILLLLIASAIIKQFNKREFIKHRPFATKYHHILGWTLLVLIVIHFILAVLEFNFHIFL